MEASGEAKGTSLTTKHSSPRTKFKNNFQNRGKQRRKGYQNFPQEQNSLFFPTQAQTFWLQCSEKTTGACGHFAGTISLPQVKWAVLMLKNHLPAIWNWKTNFWPTLCIKNYVLLSTVTDRFCHRYLQTLLSRICPQS